MKWKLLLGSLIFLTACASGGGGIQVRTLNPNEVGPLRCLGLEAHEIQTLSTQALADIRKNFLDPNPAIGQGGRPARVLVDRDLWQNEADQNINLNMIADQLSTALQRGTQGKLAFLSREHLAAIEQERALKREGKVDKGAMGLVDKIAGADYRLLSRLTDHKTQNATAATRGTTLTLTLIDLETSAQAWRWQFFIIKEGDDENYC